MTVARTPNSPGGDWLDELEQAAHAATPGPWTYLSRNAIDTPPIDVDEADWGPEGHNGLRIHTAQDAHAYRYADAVFIAAANPATVLRLINELRRTKRAAQTLGHVIEQQGRDVLDATGMHHVIGEDGDGDWAVVWEVLADQAAERRVLAAKVAAVEKVVEDWGAETVHKPRSPHYDRLRAALEGGER